MAHAPETARHADRTSTGVPGLDRLLDGGFPRQRAVLLCGAAGTGKTTLGLQFLLAGLAGGERGAIVSLDQKPEHILEDADRLGWELTPRVTAGDLTLLDASPYFTATRERGRAAGVDARQVASDLVRQVRTAKVSRLVVDSLTSLVPPDLSPGAAHDYVRALIQSLEENVDGTLLLTCRACRHPQGSCDAARYLAAGVLQLRLVRRDGAYARLLRVRKMRGAAVVPGDYPLVVDGRGAFAVEPGADRGVDREDVLRRLMPRRAAAAAP